MDEGHGAHIPGLKAIDRAKRQGESQTVIMHSCLRPPCHPDMTPCGPAFCVSSQTLGGVCWRFNAWGGTFSPCDKDQRVGRLVLGHSGVEAIHTYEAPFVLEGGSIHTDGEV